MELSVTCVDCQLDHRIPIKPNKYEKKRWEGKFQRESEDSPNLWFACEGCSRRIEVPVSAFEKSETDRETDREHHHQQIVRFVGVLILIVAFLMYCSADFLLKTLLDIAGPLNEKWHRRIGFTYIAFVLAGLKLLATGKWLPWQGWLKPLR